MLYSNDPNVTELELLIELLLLSREVSLRDVVNKFQDFKKLFLFSSATINKFLKNSFVSTEMSNAITNIKWEKGDHSIIFGSQTAQYSEKQIRRLI